MLKTLKRNAISWKVSIWTFPEKQKTSKSWIFNSTLVTSKIALPTVGVPGKQDDWRLKQFLMLFKIFVSSSLFLALGYPFCGGGKVKDSSLVSIWQIQRQKQIERQVQIQIHYFGGGGGNKDGLGEVIFLSIGRGCGLGGISIVNNKKMKIYFSALVWWWWWGWWWWGWWWWW